MSINVIFDLSDFHYLKIVNNIFFFIFKGGLIFLSRGVCVFISIYLSIYIYIYMCVCVCVCVCVLCRIEYLAE